MQRSCHTGWRRHRLQCRHPGDRGEVGLRQPRRAPGQGLFWKTSSWAPALGRVEEPGPAEPLRLVSLPAADPLRWPPGGKADPEQTQKSSQGASESPRDIQGRQGPSQTGHPPCPRPTTDPGNQESLSKGPTPFLSETCLRSHPGEAGGTFSLLSMTCTPSRLMATVTGFRPPRGKKPWAGLSTSPWKKALLVGGAGVSLSPPAPRVEWPGSQFTHRQMLWPGPVWVPEELSGLRD